MDLVKIQEKNHERIIIVQLAIKFLILVIFLGYIMIWIMMPTNLFWLHWLPSIHAKSDSTFLGQQGANILVYTFPILLIATLGCLYLHLEKYMHGIDDRKAHGFLFASWRKPALVKGPLGVVSWAELSILFMLTALLVWSFSAYVHGMFKNITRMSAAAVKESVWEVKLDSAALLLGLVGNICLAFLFIPVTRLSSILNLLGLSSESTIKYHIWLGHAVMTLFSAHGLCYTIFWAKTSQILEMLRWRNVGISNVAGGVALLSGLAMWITSFPRIRRRLFELFYYTHHLYVVFVVFFILHVNFSYACIALPGFYLFLIDRYLRFWQSQQRACVFSARVLPCHAVELNFSKHPRLNYTPGSFVFINVKSISKIEWHPFTVTSSSNMDPDKLSIVIKSEGSWSQKLYEKLSCPTSIDHLEASIEGPYGSPSNSFLRYNKLVMVSGGSGITPFISVIRELIFLTNTTSCQVPKILLISAFKKSEDLVMLDLILPASNTMYDISHLQLQIQAFVTREKYPEIESQKPQEYILFKPSSLDRPLSPILGPNSWLWLGAIISSSFVTFLLMISILTRYYIYPIDHNTNMTYSYTAKSVISILFVCASIVIMATLAFIWNKRQNAKDSVQIQNMNSPTPMASPIPESWFPPVDRELESLPHHSFSFVTTIYHGERPDLRKILFESEESDIGVLVSGPSGMRKEVAAICASSPTKTLHYESFSFAW